MKYNFELQQTQETYSVIDQNEKAYTLEFIRVENMGWKNTTVFDIETDKDITDTNLGFEIIEQFNKE